MGQKLIWNEVYIIARNTLFFDDAITLVILMHFIIRQSYFRECVLPKCLKWHESTL